MQLHWKATYRDQNIAETWVLGSFDCNHLAITKSTLATAWQHPVACHWWVLHRKALKICFYLYRFTSDASCLLLGCVECVEMFSGYFWSFWSLCGGLCDNERWRVLMCCVICLWMAGGKSLCLRLQHKVTQMEDPRDSCCSFPLFLFLSAAVNLISEMYQTDTDKRSTGKHKENLCAFKYEQQCLNPSVRRAEISLHLFQSFPSECWTQNWCLVL